MNASALSLHGRETGFLWTDIPLRLAIGVLQIFQLALLLPMHIAWLGTQLAFHAAFSALDAAFGLGRCQVE